MGELLIGLLVVLLVAGGAICGLIAMGRTSALEQDLRKMRQQLQRLETRLAAREQADLRSPEPISSAVASMVTADVGTPAAEVPLAPVALMGEPALAVPHPTAQQAPVQEGVSQKPAQAPLARQEAVRQPVTSSVPPKLRRAAGEQLERELASRWMVWVGGVALAFGGIFLVKFGVEHSVLGPTGRLVAAGILGLALVLASEWLRQRDLRLALPRLGSQADYVPAALAGGGVIAWYASLLMAFDHYGLMGPGVAFALLALVSLLALALSLLQGPLLAVLGLLGGYLVPALVFTGQGTLPGLLGYVALVSLAALALQFHVQRRWLWWGTLAGHFLWFLLALTLYRDESGFVVSYLLLSLYAFIALPGFGWRLQSDAQQVPLVGRACSSVVTDAHWVAILGSVLMLVLLSFLDYPLVGWLALLGLLVGATLLACRIVALDLFPWLASACLLLAVLWFDYPFAHMGSHGWGQLAQEQLMPLWRWGMGLALLQGGLALLWLPRAQRAGLWSSLLVTVPLAMLALLYWRSPVGVEGVWSDASLFWPLQALVLFVVFSALSEMRRQWPQIARVALLAGGHGALALAFIMFLAEESLTIAFALQLAALARLARREGDLVPHWLIKGLAMVIVVRLSLNPWLLDYPQLGRFGLHWSLYGYGIPVLCFFAAARWLPSREGSNTNAWLEAGALQLMTLWLTLEGRYWLSGGQPWQAEYTLADTALTSVTWGALALIYGWKSRLGGSLARVYAIASPLLLVLMMAMTLLGSTLRYNPLWVTTDVGSWPIVNLTLLAWGLPALLSLLGLLQVNGSLPWLRRLLALFLFGIGMLYLTLMVRQWWQGGDISGWDVSFGEQYSYSAVWLLAAVVLMLVGSWLVQARVRQAALLILLVAVLKIFLWDMSDLDGLYRAASFLGLGLCLVGLGWFYQHYVMPRQEPPPEEMSDGQ